MPLFPEFLISNSTFIGECFLFRLNMNLIILKPIYPNTPYITKGIKRLIIKTTIEFGLGGLIGFGGLSGSGIGSSEELIVC